MQDPPKVTLLYAILIKSVELLKRAMQEGNIIAQHYPKTSLLCIREQLITDAENSSAISAHLIKEHTCLPVRIENELIDLNRTVINIPDIEFKEAAIYWQALQEMKEAESPVNNVMPLPSKTSKHLEERVLKLKQPENQKNIPAYVEEARAYILSGWNAEKQSILAQVNHSEKAPKPDLFTQRLQEKQKQTAGGTSAIGGSGAEVVNFPGPRSRA